MNAVVRKYLAEIGRRGGQKSKRKLTKAQARAMVRARMAKCATRNANAELSDAGDRDARTGTDAPRPRSLQ
jgi:hypothetical protein